MWYGLWILPALIAFLLIGMEGGRRLNMALSGPNEARAAGPIDGVVYAVLGLLVAFMFATTAARFETRRELIVEQCNALGTAWLRIDALPEADRWPIRDAMRRWAHLAGDLSTVSLDERRFQEAIREADALQRTTWQLSVDAVKRAQQPALLLFVLAPQNSWMDLTVSRMALGKLGLPPPVLVTMLVVALISAVLAGFTLPRKQWHSLLNKVGFAAAIALPMYIIFDMSEPRMGLIRIDKMDQLFAEQARSFDAELGGAEPNRPDQAIEGRDPAAARPR
jgi:hypothetical protein